jgi:hypothetical protein
MDQVPYQVKKVLRKGDREPSWVGARADVPETWGTFEVAWVAFQSGEFDGIGYKFTADDPYFGMDLDHCLGPDGEVLEWARPLLASIEGTYGEISPSGTGIKFLARGKLPGDKGKNRRGLGADGTGALELYDHGKFFALTGDAWGDSPHIADKQAAADALYAFAKERPAKPARAPRKPARAAATAARESGGNGVHDDREVLQAASRLSGFDALYGGDTTGYDSKSEADAAIMNHLAFLCGPGREAQVIRIYRGSKLGRRPKANRDDYVESTAALAYSNRYEFFDWGPRADGKAEGHAKGRPKGYLVGRDGAPLSCMSNTRIWLGANRPPDDVRYDEFRQAVLVGGEALTDRIVIDLAIEIEDALRSPWSQEHVRAALIHLGHQRRFSSVVDWLETLEWDGID